MTLEELKARVIFQINADLDDLGDYEPHIEGYMNRGYDRLVWALLEMHIPTGTIPLLKFEADVPILPEWTHHAIADFATWQIYRNGNPQKQDRGTRFLQEFLDVEGQLKALAGRAHYNEDTGEIEFESSTPQFYNVYP